MDGMLLEMILTYCKWDPPYKDDFGFVIDMVTVDSETSAVAFFRSVWLVSCNHPKEVSGFPATLWHVLEVDPWKWSKTRRSKGDLVFEGLGQNQVEQWASVTGWDGQGGWVDMRSGGGDGGYRVGQTIKLACWLSDMRRKGYSFNGWSRGLIRSWGAVLAVQLEDPL